MTIIGNEIPLISEKQSLSKVLLNDENNELSDGTNFWDKNRQLTTDEIACYLQKIAANAKNTQVNYPTGLYVPYSTRTHLEDALNENIKSDPSWPNEVQLFGNDSNLLIVFYVQIMPDDLVMQLHRF